LPSLIALALCSSPASGFESTRWKPLADAFERRDELVVAELVEGGVERAAGLGATHEVEQRGDHVAGEADAKLAVLGHDRRQQRALGRLAAERRRDALGRDQAAVEECAPLGRDGGPDLDLVRDQEGDRHRLQLAGLAGERDDLVAKTPVARLLRDQARVGVFPVELLDRKARRRLAAFGREPRENRHRGERGLDAARVDAVDREAHAALDLLAVAPGDDDDVVVAEGDGVLHAMAPAAPLRLRRPSLGRPLERAIAQRGDGGTWQDSQWRGDCLASRMPRTTKRTGDTS
jgi:hypothetical protein